MHRLSKRAWILLLLATATAVPWSLTTYQILFQANSVWATLGFVFHVEGHHLAVKSVREKDPSGRITAAFQGGLHKGDHILAMHDKNGAGRDIDSFRDFGEVMRKVYPQEPVVLTVLRDSDKTETKTLTLTLVRKSPSRIGWLLLLGLGSILPLIAIVTGCLIGFMKPEDDNAFLASLLFLSFSSVFISNYFALPPGLREFTLFFYTTLDAFLPYLLVRFFLLFPSPSYIDRKLPWLKTVFMVTTLLGWPIQLGATTAGFYSFVDLERLNRFLRYPFRVLAGLVLTMVFTSFLSLLLNTTRAETKDEKRRMVILLAGTLVGLLPLIVYVVYANLVETAVPSFTMLFILAITLGFFPLSFAYVVLKHRVLGIRVILRRGLQYALISRGFLAIEGIGIFLLIFLAVEPLLNQFFPNAGVSNVAMSMAFLTLAGVAGLRKINRQVFPVIDRRFFREAYNAQEILTDLQRAVRRLAPRPDQLLQTVAERMSSSLHPDHVAVFIRGQKEGGLASSNGPPGKLVPRFDAKNVGDYQCRWIKTRSGHEEHDIETLGEDELSLSTDSFIARYLENAATKEPAAVEVYLDDPKSWAHGLLRADQRAGQLHRERLLLERLNTRVIIPLVTNGQVLGFISMGEKLSEEPYTRSDKELLLTVAEQSAIALDYAQLVSQVAEQEKLKREIEIAQEVQAHLFPQTLPSMKTLDYVGVCRSARGVSGDYYDFLQLSPGMLGVAVGDISGKGISAALLMASLQALLRSHAPLRQEAVDELVCDINRLMCLSTAGGKYATFFYGVYDDSLRKLTYVNAGHNPPMLFRRRPTSGVGSRPVGRTDAASSATALQPLAYEGSLRLSTGGVVIGFFPDATYEKETIQLVSGDILLLFSDGVSEAMNASLEEFGESRLATLVSAHRDLTAAGLRDTILGAIDQFVGEAPQHDDLTLVVAKVL